MIFELQDVMIDVLSVGCAMWCIGWIMDVKTIVISTQKLIYAKYCPNHDLSIMDALIYYHNLFIKL